VIIVDDEDLSLNLLSAILSDIDGIELVAECNSGQAAVEAVMKYAPDVMFLDIQMPEMNGFDVIAAIQGDVLPLVIFTTAYAEYAVNAFKIQAVDYVLKPLNEDNIAESLARAKALLKVKQVKRSKPEVLEILQDISEQVKSNMAGQKPATLIVKEMDRIALLDPDNIDWIEAAGDYVCIHTGGETRIIRTTLKAIEAELSGPNFQRIHRSTLVNMSKVREVITAPKGEAFIVLADQNQLKVSRTYGAALRARLPKTA
jgi:two-component system LytT family response regulator